MTAKYTPADILAAFDDLLRIFGPPAPPEPPEDRLRRLAEDTAAERAADAREARRHWDGKALDAVEERFVARYLGRCA